MIESETDEKEVSPITALQRAAWLRSGEHRMGKWAFEGLANGGILVAKDGHPRYRIGACWRPAKRPRDNLGKLGGTAGEVLTACPNGFVRTADFLL